MISGGQRWKRTYLVRTLAEIGGPTDDDVAEIAEVSKATVSRWKDGAIKPQPSNELILSDLYCIVGRLSAYYAPDEVRGWIYARYPRLGGERAIDLIH